MLLLLGGFGKDFLDEVTFQRQSKGRDGSSHEGTWKTSQGVAGGREADMPGLLQRGGGGAGQPS